jgi:hypothetical protein
MAELIQASCHSQPTETGQHQPFATFNTWPFERRLHFDFRHCASEGSTVQAGCDSRLAAGSLLTIAILRRTC